MVLDLELAISLELVACDLDFEASLRFKTGETFRGDMATKHLPLNKAQLILVDDVVAK